MEPEVQWTGSRRRHRAACLRMEPEVLWTGSRRRHVVSCVYVCLCVVHGGPLLFTVFFGVVCAVVHDDVRLATATLDSIQVTTSDRHGLKLVHTATPDTRKLVMSTSRPLWQCELDS